MGIRKKMLCFMLCMSWMWIYRALCRKAKRVKNWLMILGLVWKIAVWPKARFFSQNKPIFCRNTGHISRKSGVVMRKKSRLLGVLPFFKRALIYRITNAGRLKNLSAFVILVPEEQFCVIWANEIVISPIRILHFLCLVFLFPSPASLDFGCSFWYNTVNTVC